MNFISSFVEYYKYSKEFSDAKLLGLENVTITIDTTNTVYYEDGVNSIELLLLLENNTVKSIITTKLCVDALYFGEYSHEKSLDKELSSPSKIEVNSNRANLKVLYIYYEYDEILFSLDNYKGIKVKVMDNKNKITPDLLKEYDKFDDGSISISITYNSTDLTDLYKVLQLTKLDILDLNLICRFNTEDEEYDFYDKVYADLERMQFFSRKKSILTISSKLLMDNIVDYTINKISTRWLGLFHKFAVATNDNFYIH